MRHQQLEELIPKLTSEAQTYRDWREGGSLNQLNLDYGQYYVEHCITFFEKHYQPHADEMPTFEGSDRNPISRGEGGDLHGT